MGLTEEIVLLLIGFFSGAYGVIVGAGGGFIFVPALLILFHLSPPIAAGTGLTIVLLNSLSGTIGYIRKKRINYKLGSLLALGAAPGTFIGVRLSQIIPTKAFYISFSFILVALGIFLLIKNKPNKQVTTSKLEAASSIDTATPENEKYSRVTLLRIFTVGMVMGIVSNFFGIGGGWLLVPILIYGFKIVPHLATATSLYSLCLYAFVGVLIQLFHHHIDWSISLWSGIGVLLGAQLGVIVSEKLSGKVIIQLLSFLLIGVGFKLMFT